MPTSLLQTEEWGRFKEQFGWRATRVGGILVLERNLPFGQRFLYAPEPSEAELTADSLDELVHHAWERRAMVLKLEPLVVRPARSFEQHLVRHGFSPSFETLQPSWRQWVALEPSVEQILADMKPKGRYNIRIAQRAGVQVHEFEDVEQFSALATATARRQGFSPRSTDYFKKLCALGTVTLLGAWLEKDLLAAFIVSLKPPYALYLYGASSQHKREAMAPYLLHWNVIEGAKAAHCTTYDLLAISPPDKPKHRFANLTRFKQQFGGQQVELVGAWDLVLRKSSYKAFHLLEKLRRPQVE